MPKIDHLYLSPIHPPIGVFFSAIAAVLLMTIPVTAQSQPWDKELASDFPKALRKLEIFYAHVHGRAIARQKTAAKSQERVNDLEFALDGERSRLAWSCRADPFLPKIIGSTVVWVVNPSVSFVLHKNRGQTDYIVDWAGGASTPAQDIESAKQKINFELRELAAPYSLSDTHLSLLMSHPNYRVRRVEEVSQDGVPGLRVYYSANNSPADKNSPFANWPDTVEGWFIVSPKLGWAVQAYQERSYDSRNPNDPRRLGKNASVNGKVWYEGEQDGIPLVKKVDYRILADGQPSTSWTIVEFSDLRHEPTPQSEFTPAAFGVTVAIPEPPGRIRPYVWLGLAALLALAAAVTFRILARRKARAAPHSP